MAGVGNGERAYFLRDFACRGGWGSVIPPAMKLGYAILYVKDVPRSVAFYEDAFGLSRRFVHEAGMYAEMDTGATTLSFAANGLAKSNLPCGFRENSLCRAARGFRNRIHHRGRAGRL